MAMKSKVNVGLHIVSHYADFIYPEDIDIINTQCHGLQQLKDTMVTIPLYRQPKMTEPKWFLENTAFIGKWKALDVPNKKCSIFFTFRILK